MSQGPDPYAGMRQAAAQGNGLAAAYLAVLAGLGKWEKQNWRLALRRLGRAAELGYEPAKTQMRVICDQPDADGDWAQLAQETDLSPWLSAAEVRVLHDNPRICDLPGFLSPAACRWLVGRAQGRLTPAQVYRSSGEMVQDASRDNTGFTFTGPELDLVVVLLRAKIAATFGKPIGALEPLQILHYAPGQRFKQHTDYLGPATPELAADLAQNGQRDLTVLGYLNDAYEGGETDFPRLKFRYRGQPGDVLMFRNVDPAGEPDPMTLHAGLPPTSGEKWLFTQWIRAGAPQPAG